MNAKQRYEKKMYRISLNICPSEKDLLQFVADCKSRGVPFATEVKRIIRKHLKRESQ